MFFPYERSLHENAARASPLIAFDWNVQKIALSHLRKSPVLQSTASCICAVAKAVTNSSVQKMQTSCKICRTWRSIVGWLFLLSLWMEESSAGDEFSFHMVYKFSEESKAIMQRRTGQASLWLPKEGTPAYYRELVKHDYHRHGGRSLLDSNELLYFSEGNETFLLPSLGGLHYTFVSLGFPNKSFLVALDTGSDLFWIPCDCSQCAPTSGRHYGLKNDLSVYSTKISKTSKQLPCGDNLCTISPTCEVASQPCDYVVKYVSPNTSTKGTLVEDLLYLTSDKKDSGVVNATVIFGCGQVQTGTLLEVGPPDGILGLGRQNISVLSTLARAGLVPNSFSMCFSSSDASGRLLFGDKGAQNQSTTPYKLTKTFGGYLVGIEGVIIEGKPLELSENVLFDSGTAITRLPTLTYQALAIAVGIPNFCLTPQLYLVRLFEASTFKIQIPLFLIFALSFRVQVNEQVNLTLYQDPPFKYCWTTSDSKNLEKLPTVSITFSGGNNFTVQNPYLYLVDVTTQRVIGACLGVLEDNLAIIGHNFMQGQKLVFDQEEMVLGWTESDCYNLAGGVSAPAETPEPSSGSSVPKGSPHVPTESPRSPLAPQSSPRAPRQGELAPIPTEASSATQSLSALHSITLLSSFLAICML